MNHLEAISSLTKEEFATLETVGLPRLIAFFMKRIEHDRDIAKDVMQNFPEASICVHCHGWDYNKGDGDDWKLYFDPDLELTEEDYIIPMSVNALGNDSYIVTLDMVMKALIIFRELMDNKILHCYGANQNDPETWDAVVYDAIIQIALFGSVLLG